MISKSRLSVRILQIWTIFIWLQPWFFFFEFLYVLSYFNGNGKAKMLLFSLVRFLKSTFVSPHFSLLFTLYLFLLMFSLVSFTFALFIFRILQIWTIFIQLRPWSFFITSYLLSFLQFLYRLSDLYRNGNTKKFLLILFYKTLKFVVVSLIGLLLAPYFVIFFLTFLSSYFFSHSLIILCLLPL